MHTYVQTVFSLIHPMERVWTGEAQPMLIPESSCVCIPSLRAVTPRVCFAKVRFKLSFFWPDPKTGKGVALYDDTDSKYIWVCKYNYLGPSVFKSIIFLIFSLCTQRGRSVARWDPPHVIRRVKLCVHAKF